MIFFSNKSDRCAYQRKIKEELGMKERVGYRCTITITNTKTKFIIRMPQNMGTFIFLAPIEDSRYNHHCYVVDVADIIIQK